MILNIILMVVILSGGVIIKWLLSILERTELLSVYQS